MAFPKELLASLSDICFEYILPLCRTETFIVPLTTGVEGDVALFLVLLFARITASFDTLHISFLFVKRVVVAICSDSKNYFGLQIYNLFLKKDCFCLKLQ